MIPTKFVSYRQLKVGQEIKGYKLGNWQTLCTMVVKAINPNFVSLAWQDEDVSKQISTENMFEVEMTQEEIIRTYSAEAKEIYDNLDNIVPLYQAGYHEMWNAWISYDVFDMAVNCRYHKIKFVGIVKDIVPKLSFFSDEPQDIGLVAEYIDNGERFWCHYNSKDVEDMKKWYLQYIDDYDKGGKINAEKKN